MGKTKNPKRNREKPLEHEDMPRKYRQIMNLEKHKVQKETKTEKLPISNGNQPDIQHSVNKAQFKQTNKYKKRKDYLNGKNKKVEERIVKVRKDNVKFGETVKEPPKITKLPKRKKEKEMSLLEKSKLQKQREFAIQEYRKLKTRERMQREKKKLNLSLK
ncbi:hypothetical protein HDV01_004752 [Terramyces sp. JEL0728]|nr:hypothetical protein HDV01_004752 [Terramyces sp. JEL0728]